jgi:Transketolase, N-terminal subunit
MNLSEKELDSLRQRATQIRRDIVTMIYQAGDGHPGPSLSAADIVTALYFKVLNVRPEQPDWRDRDRFVLSKGHACPAVYAALARRGYFSTDLYPTLRKLHSTLQGHPDMTKTPGVDMTSGSLGNGLSTGLGMALAARAQGRDYRTYVLCGDGELGEGVVWEAALAAAKYKVNALTLFIDNNGMQSGGPVPKVGGIVALPEKWRAFGWNVLEIDGHDMAAILAAVEEAKAYKEGPTAVIAHTVKGKGVPYMENNNAWHKGVPSDEQYEAAMRALGGVAE